jgi:hypothetical protein
MSDNMRRAEPETALVRDLTDLSDALVAFWSVRDATSIRHKTGTILH